jgi:UDP-N-acetylmuramyl pentapeptide phosphotransferase/UDP-N-acetylglucosamine-1-phosphate transferase
VTVRGGGIGLAFGTLVGLAVLHSNLTGSAWIALVLASVGFGVIGFADDLTGAFPVFARLAMQLVVAVPAALVICLHGPRGAVPVALLIALAAVWIVSFVNAFNFMDGITGISSAEATVAGLAFALIARREHQLVLQSAALMLVAGTAGFVPFNFPSARVFLGDVGSYFVGAWLAILVIIGLRGSIPADAMIAPISLYIADTGFALVRRVLRHESWHQAHRQHTYQRLVDHGLSHTLTTGIVFTAAAVCSVLGSVSLLGSIPERIVADNLVVAVIAGYLALPHMIKHRRSMRHAND